MYDTSNRSNKQETGMPKTVNMTRKNSIVMAFRVLKDDKTRIEKAARATGQLPGEFMRVGVLNEVDYVEKQ